MPSISTSKPLLVVPAAGLDVLVGHRRGDPQGVAVAQQPGEGGHEPAAAAARDQLAALVALEGRRAAVGEQDEPGCSMVTRPEAVRPDR